MGRKPEEKTLINELQKPFIQAGIKTRISRNAKGIGTLTIYGDGDKRQGWISEPEREGGKPDAYGTEWAMPFSRLDVVIGATLSPENRCARNAVYAIDGSERIEYFGEEYLVPPHDALIGEIQKLQRASDVARITLHRARSQRAENCALKQMFNIDREIDRLQKLVKAWERVEARQQEADNRERFHYSEDRSWRAK